MKKFIFALVSVFVVLWICDFLIHGVILKQAYMDTAHLWRPLPEMKTALATTCSVVFSVFFVWIYTMLAKKGVASGIKFGILMGIIHGFGMGFGSYATMPITLFIAVVWFLGSVVEMTLAGLLTGVMLSR